MICAEAAVQEGVELHDADESVLTVKSKDGMVALEIELVSEETRSCSLSPKRYAGGKS